MRGRGGAGTVACWSALPGGPLTCCLLHATCPSWMHITGSMRRRRCATTGASGWSWTSSGGAVGGQRSIDSLAAQCLLLPSPVHSGRPRSCTMWCAQAEPRMVHY